MRLEFEPNVTTLPLVDDEVFETFDPSPAHDLGSLLKKGIAAAQNGERDNARKLLSQAVAVDPQCEDAWMWLASLSDYPEELLAFLDRVLSINPDNARAVEWRQATRALLAKTFVQRADSARHEGSDDLAAKYLDQALACDEKCVGAWFLRASMSEADDEQLEFLDRILESDPNNEQAKEAIAAIRAARSQAAFVEAKQAAVEGDLTKAMEILDAFLEDVPDSVEAWILKSHLSPGLEQKIEALEKALDIDPENAAARSGLAFLALTFGSSNDALDTKPAQAYEGSTDDGDESVDAADEPEAPYYRVENADEDPEIASQPTAEPMDLDGPQDERQAHGYENGDAETIDPSPGEADAQVEPDHQNEQEAEHGRSVEELFGPAEDVVDSERETVEYLSPLVPESLNETDAAEDEFAVEEFSEDAPDAPKFDSKVDASGVACPFCASTNDQHAFECASCHATLTLSDIEALFAGHRIDREVLQNAVTQMEAEWNLREFGEAELTALGIGHFNLGNTEAGLKYLQEASRLDPNNVILAGQVNALAIRLDEMRRQNEVNDAKPTGKTILVVDDSPTVRKLISGKLEKSGHVVICAADGVEALEHLEDGIPDLVLLDITMPRMDGYEVCKNIRANPQAKDLPVVMISGKDGFFDKVRGRMAGSTGYVTKPFGPETLMKALETYLLPEA